MEYRKLGHSGLKVSSLCLGTMTFGEPSEGSMMHGVASDEKTAFSIMDRALEAGINFWDTANVYGNDGLTERVLGNWFEQSKRRDEVVLATKFRFRMGKGPNDTGASRYQIRSAVEQSLRRLKTDRIDLYQIHMQDNDTPEEETLRALDDLVRQGKVLYLGASNYAAYRLVDSLWTSKTQLLSRFVALQAQYSLVVRELEREHVPVCEQFGLGILPWSPLAGGFLSGKYRKDRPPPEASRLEKFKSQLSQFDTPRHWRVLEAVDAVAAELKATPSQVSLAWLLRKRAVTSVIFGARNLAQLEDNLKAAELKLDDAQQKRLDDASALELGYPYEFMNRVMGRW
ncbi:Predicted oxidoreductase [Stigmatella aurantiaca]|uniref:Predicted oxidoreductase n=1 Tax=Stigmatella aurantiaca TaxID=41 RepID=A0A1H7WQU1_STIAU|nr:MULTISPECIES: aldo/keto reductase [Stigmatella]SEM23872.1 Predicted oxidoreductase [Stigmatella aurantiaca]